MVVGLTGLVLPGITAAVFAARLFSTFLLALSLIFTDRICRLRSLGSYRSILILLAVGLAPLTSFVSSYVQPDNMSLCLVTGGLLLLHRWRGTRGIGDLAAIGVCLGLLLVTKYQFFACLGIATLGLFALMSRQMPWSHRLRDGLLLTLPSVATGAVNLWVLARGNKAFLLIDTHGSVQHISSATLITHFQAGPWPFLAYIEEALRSAIADYFLGGNTFRSYWGWFGWTDTPIMILNPSTTTVVFNLLETATALVAVLLILLFLKRASSAISALRVGNRWEAATLVVGDPVVVTYGSFVCFMLLLWVVVGDSFYAQGRNWFPVLPAAVIVTVSVAPRGIPWPRWQGRVSNALLGGLVAYSLVGSFFAFSTIHHRYYGAGRAVQPVTLAGLPQLDGEGDFDLLRFALPNTVSPPPASQAVPLGGTVAVAGWAFDRLASAPARAVFIEVDDRPAVQAFYGDPTSDLASAGAPAYGRAGFDAIIGTKGLLPGRHSFTVLVVSADGMRLYRSGKRFDFEVSSS